MTSLRIGSLSELRRAAEAVLQALDERTGDGSARRSVVVFRGGMGAGKTTLIREIVARLGATDTVTSPTFAIVNEYAGAERDGSAARRIYHFDFYRIDRIEEAYDFGYEEYFYSDELCLVEWPEKIEPLLPPDVLTVRISVGEDEERIIEIA